MRQLQKAAIAVAGLLVAQALAWFAYRTVEGRRSEHTGSSRFDYERVSGPVPTADILLEQSDGHTVKLGSYGENAILLHFWATWCGPCSTELPSLLRLAQSLERDRGVRVLLVSVDDDWATIAHFFPEQVPQQVLLDRTALARRTYGVGTLPQTYVLAPGLRPIARVQGPRDWRAAAATEALAQLVPGGF